MTANMELWRQCGDWLVRLEVLPPNHRICWPDATVQDLAYALRDGVLLCILLEKIDPSSIDMKHVNRRPALARFLCVKNIRLFLASCAEHYEIKQTDLFKDTMLYDYGDFAQVLRTLSRLSLSARAVRMTGGQGFPATHASPSHDEEKIYRALEDMVSDDQYTDYYNKHLGGGGFGNRSMHYFALGDKGEDIYEDLCSFNSNKNALGGADWQLPPPKEKRDYILKELLETESNYVEVLNVLRKHFIFPISCMKDSDKKIVFMNIQDLGKTHAGFHKDLLDALVRRTGEGVGEVFLDYKDKFLKYGEYCAQLPRAIQLLETICQKSDQIRDEISKCELSAKDGKFRLSDLLAVPMQRILKYHLLLRELLHNTPNTHEEYFTIQQAYEAMLDVSDFVNEVKRDSEQLAIIKDIQVSILDLNLPTNMELKDYGRLRKDCELRVQSHDAPNKTKNRYVFVFDKVVLVCKQGRGEQYTFKKSLKVQDYRVQDVPTRRVSRDTRWAFTFLLAHKDQTDAYTLFARTEDEKNKMITALTDALNTVNPTLSLSSNHQPLMHSFDRPTACQYCHKLLKGLFYQGYQCQTCRKALHRQCLPLLTQCGPAGHPPALPPRPPSMQLPFATGEDNRVSGVSLDDLTINSIVEGPLDTPVPPPSASLPSLNVFNPMPMPPQDGPDYVNTRIEEYSWFVGDMDRETANSYLQKYPVGTFMVRNRAQGGAALSLRTSDDSKHMKINEWDSGIDGEQKKFYLSDSRMFRSVVELVSWYTVNSLKESFSGLDMNLKFPVRDLVLMLAAYDFNPDDSALNMLPLKSGDVVAIIDQMENSLGWWKAAKHDAIGYIPKDFVSTYKH